MWKTSLRIVGQACFALISFIVVLFLASLFFLALGLGLGTGLGEGGFKDLSEVEKLSYRYISGDQERIYACLRSSPASSFDEQDQARSYPFA
jgi:hypothetical protein